MCLTYTRTAAANMRAAVFRRLATLATAREADLPGLLAGLGIAPVNERHIKNGRRLFAEALETPGGLRIQTIHAFCESVLRRFPLEANIAGHFELLQGAAETALLAQARRDVLDDVTSTDTQLAAAFEHVFVQVGEAGFDGLVAGILANRLALQSLIPVAAGPAGDFGPLYAAFGFDPAETEAAIAATIWPAGTVDGAVLRAMHAAAHAANTGVQAKGSTAGALDALSIADPGERADALMEAWLTDKGQPYAKIAVKDVVAQMAAFGEHYLSAAEHMALVRERLNTFRLAHRTRHAMVLARALIARIDALKQARGLLDFADLIDATVRLLSRRDVGAWVRYKLDTGIDHVLLDEAQDTGPQQWAVLRQLTEEIFDNSASANRRRTLFVVGDPKQSIYSFQGARPESFEEERRHYDKKARASGLELHHETFNASFRSGPDVLSATDAVFAMPQMMPGVAAEERGTAHMSLRQSAPGRVDVWPLIPKLSVPAEDDWTAVVQSETAPEVVLARQIATTVQDWIDTGFARAGDVLVLVRQRGPFVHALARELKERAIPAAGADRLNLLSHIAVQDLLALAAVVLQPADDLALAAFLKSPVFGFGDEDLLALSPGRKADETLLAALAASGEAYHRAAAARIHGWRAIADTVAVHDFFALILGRDGVRRDLVARLGHEAEDVLDEFLRAAADSERSGTASLDGFLAAMRDTRPTSSAKWIRRATRCAS
ncbi:MAG: UvrD-helicase domain-containing protein [Phyllobacteriaceae bacterium]|nr:UvrD-helicase domain-containing protein [Phyllobacteriaceae bacterium]